MEWFLNPIKNQYADFDGRTMRKPFWMFILIYIIVSAILSTFEDFLGMKETPYVSGLYGLILLLPSLAITTRRLHDTGRSGWWQLLWLLPIIGWIILVVFLAQDTVLTDNAYGANPKAVVAAQSAPVATPPVTPAP
jgi:uncharacterized membrane protein YhaH (DUF805 family)